MAMQSNSVLKNKALRLRTAIAWSIASAGLGLVAACGGGGGGGAAAVALAASACPAGQLALESGCADAALTAEQVRGAVRDAMAELDLRSAIVSVSVGDTPVLTQAWGESAPGQPATVDMQWRNGSIAIAYLTTALLQLQDQGVLSLDDKLRSAAAFATGQLISPKAYAQLVAPTTAAFSPQGKARYYGLGIFLSNGWLLQNPFFFGYSSLMAYLPAQKIAIAVTSTLGPHASPDGNMSDLLFRRIVQRLTPSRMP